MKLQKHSNTTSVLNKTQHFSKKTTKFYNQDKRQSLPPKGKTEDTRIIQNVTKYNIIT